MAVSIFQGRKRVSPWELYSGPTVLASILNGITGSAALLAWNDVYGYWITRWPDENYQNSLFAGQELESDIENRQMDTAGAGEGGMDWQSSIEIKCITTCKIDS